MFKIIKRAFRLLFLLALLIYAALYWRSLRGVEAFLELYPTNLKVEYDWLYPGFQGEVYLHNIRIFNHLNETVVKAEQLIIDTGSFSALITAKESLLLREFPPTTQFRLIKARTTDKWRFSEVFDYFPNLQLTPALLPEQCQQLSFEPQPFNFTAGLVVFYDITASTIQWSANIESADFAKVKMQLKQANFNPMTGDIGFVDEWELVIDDPLWLQQLTQQCQKLIPLPADSKPAEFYKNIFFTKLVHFAKQNNWSLRSEFNESLTNFLYSPHHLKIAFEPPKGIGFEQLAQSNATQFPTITGLSVKLNDDLFSDFFAARDYMSAMEKSATVRKQESEKKSKPVPEYLPIRYNVLKRYLDSKIEVTLTQGQSFIGYLRVVDDKGIQLEKREFKGSSMLPFAYDQIGTIKLMKIIP